MREILFKGKRKNNGEWVEGYYIHIPEGEGTYDEERHLIQQIHNNGIIGFSVDVIPETVGQYTGLTDKNGKKIFGGDIVKDFIPFNFTCNGQKLYKENTYIVEYDNEKCGFKPFCERDYHGEPIIEECVVIGNIYDNPELLKGGAE